MLSFVMTLIQVPVILVVGSISAIHQTIYPFDDFLWKYPQYYLKGYTDLHRAIIRKDQETVLEMLKTTNVNDARNIGSFYYSAGNPSLYPSDKFYNLRKKFACPYPYDAKGNLIPPPSDKNINNNLGDSPLHLAIRAGNPDIISILLQKGANANQKNFLGLTPLHTAIGFVGHFFEPFTLTKVTQPNKLFQPKHIAENVCLFNEFNDSSPEMMDKIRSQNAITLIQSMTPSDIQKDSFLFDSITFHRNAVFDALIDTIGTTDSNTFHSYINSARNDTPGRFEYMFDKDKKDTTEISTELTPLDCAILFSNAHAITRLVQNGANLYQKNSHGFAPIHRAAFLIQNGPIAIKTLLDLVDIDHINLKDDKGYTLLHIAVSQLNIPFVDELLSKKGVDIHAKTKDGLSVMDMISSPLNDWYDEPFKTFKRESIAKRLNAYVEK